ncbi:MAG: hypothetical protein JXA46_13635 [Dehalococcoidales bacterium]|nr:hypothetical protein [Dehalococcoidales bacterium]
MKTKQDGIPNAFNPYKQEEVNLILSLTPTYINVKNLAKSLGRTTNAIYVIYQMAYSGKWLKNMLNDMDDSQDNVVTKIAKAKKRQGIFVGLQEN